MYVLNFGILKGTQVSDHLVAIFSHAGALVVVQTRGIARPIKSHPVPLFAQKPLKLYSQIIFIGRIAFLL